MGHLKKRLWLRKKCYQGVPRIFEAFHNVLKVLVHLKGTADPKEGGFQHGKREKIGGAPVDLTGQGLKGFFQVSSLLSS